MPLMFSSFALFSSELVYQAGNTLFRDEVSRELLNQSNLSQNGNLARPLLPMNYLLTLVAFLAASVVSNASAACEHSAKEIFSCNTSEGKRIQVCASPVGIEYSFGAPAKAPEIVVNVPRAKASTYQWAGFGRWHNYSIDVPNGKTIYRVFSGHDSQNPDQPLDAGVQVIVKGEEVATVACVPESVNNYIEGVELKKTTM